MIIFSKVGKIVEAISASNFSNFVVAVYYGSSDRIDVFQGEEGDSTEMLDAFSEPIDKEKVFSVLINKFPKVDFLSKKDVTFYLCFVDKTNFDGVLFFTIDDTGYLRLSSPNERIKCLRKIKNETKIKTELEKTK